MNSLPFGFIALPCIYTSGLPLAKRFCASPDLISNSFPLPRLDLQYLIGRKRGGKVNNLFCPIQKFFELFFLPPLPLSFSTLL
jgi:hypothetical protein